MKNNNIKLLYITPLWLASNAIRYSHDNHHLSDTEDINVIGSKDYDLIKRVGFKMKHESVLEHSLIVLEIEASRALLQELSRHRVGISPTVKSTRYTLKELKDEDCFCNLEKDYNRASKYVVFTIHKHINQLILENLDNVRELIKLGYSNDDVKYILPESFKFKGQYSFNLRSLLHLLKLRIDRSALHEFRLLSKNIIDALPLEYKELVLLDEQIKKNYNEFLSKY